MFPYSFNNLYGYLRFSNMYMSSPTIEEKLKKTDCHLDELLDEDEIIQEMKNQNAKLLNYFEKKNVKLLLDYIIREPEDDDQKKGHKYPFIASEILNCDVSKINELFTTTEHELILKDRKLSSMSNPDSDVVLTTDDQTTNAFSNEETLKQLDQTENQKESEENKLGKESELSNQKSETLCEVNGNFNNPNNTSIGELQVENLEKTTHNQSDLQDKHSNRIELLDHLLSFVETDIELNYVLVGYFSKFLNLLLNKFPHKIIGYIYNERPEILDRLISHVDKKSISEFVPKLLLIESYLSSDKDKQTSNSIEKSSNSNLLASANTPLSFNLDSILEIRKRLLTKLFLQLSIEEKNTEKTSSICNICIEIIENRNVLEIILADKHILEHLTSQLAINTEQHKVMADFDHNYNYNEILNVFNNLIRFSQIENLKSPTYSLEGEDMVNSEGDNNNGQIENTLLGEYVLNNLENILKNFAPSSSSTDVTDKLDLTDHDKENFPSNFNLIEGTFGFLFKPLGSKRVKLVELVHFLLGYFKNVQSVLDKILVRSEFLKYLFQYFFQYEWNNIYQLNFENLMKTYLNNINNHPEITRHLFSELNILNVFISHGSPCHQVNHNSDAELESGFSFNSNRKINHGYFAVLIEICNKISLLENSNPKFKEAYWTPEWDTFIKEKINFWKKLFDRKLCVPEIHNVGQTDETGHVHANITEEEEESNKEKSEELAEETRDQNESPFQRDEYFFQMGNENDDWLNPKKEDNLHPESNLLEDINSFEFVDDNRTYHIRRSSQEEILLKEKDLHNWKVDEIDDGNYSDTSYWKGVAQNVLSSESVTELMKELEL